MTHSISVKREKDSLYYYTFFFLLFLEILLAFSAFGYIVITPISITSIHIPVLIGALLLGPAEGLFLGAVFGLTSMWIANTTAVVFTDMVFSPFISTKPMESIFLCLGVRMIFGLAAGFLFLFVKRRMHCKKAGITLCSTFAIFLHSFLIYGFIGVYFPESGLSFYTAILDLKQTRIWLNFILSSVIILFVYSLYHSEKVYQFKQSIVSIKKKKQEHKFNTHIIIFIIITSILIFSLLIHFYSSIEILLNNYNVSVEHIVITKFHHIGLQFIAALFAFCGLIAIVINLFQLYSFEMKFKSDHDLMTGLYNKTFMTQKVKIILQEQNKKHFGTFIMLDLDNFKAINDTYGHPFGDKLLIQVADILTSSFSKQDLISRFGGDEFCIYCPENNSLEQVCFMVNNVYKKLKDIAFPDKTISEITCSVGISIPQQLISFEELYKQADTVLYRSKQQGKNQYMIYQYNNLSKTDSI